MTTRQPIATDRRRFLRHAGGILGTGIGVALLPSAAQAREQRFSTRCCRDSDCPFCPRPQYVRYRCTNRCTQQTFCACYTPQGECFTTGC